MIDNLSKTVGFSVPLLRSAQEVVFSKAGAKLLLFFDIPKFFPKKMRTFAKNFILQPFFIRASGTKQ